MSTFMTGVDSVEAEDTQPEEDKMGMSTEELIIHVERQMREFERNAQYLEAEQARLHLESLKKRQQNVQQRELETIQQNDVKVFLDMVQQHQENFDHTWEDKIMEHKMRADDLIDNLKWKHDEQQRELYEMLRKKRMPKFSVELLNLRKKQVLLARNKKYVQAEKVKRKGDILEAFEIDNIRRAAKEENQIRFKALLKRQHWDRQALADKLRIEKKQLLEAKSQDFEQLKKRLKNAEKELKKTHIRQALQSDKKLAPLYSTLHYGKGGESGAQTARRPKTWDAGKGQQRAMGMSTYASSKAAMSKPRSSARDLARQGRFDQEQPAGHPQATRSHNPYDDDDSLSQFAQQQTPRQPQTART